MVLAGAGGSRESLERAWGNYASAFGLWAVVLAGGEGIRLRAFGREVLGSDRPKQFCRIIGTRSMLRHTWDRAARVVQADCILTVVTAGHEPYIAEEGVRGVPGTVLVQPENKGTAAGLVLALLWIAGREPNATVIVFPADHFVWEEERFASHVQAAVATSRCSPDRVVVLGVEPEGPDTDYGWIAPGAPLAGGGTAELYAVRRFWEKPDRDTAARLLSRGYLWSTLVLAGSLRTYVGMAAAGIPRVLAALGAAAATLGTSAEARAMAQAYAHIPPTDRSRAVLARYPEGLAVLAARGVCWSDWGSAERIVRTLGRFDRRPRWLPAYARAQAQGSAGVWEDSDSGSGGQRGDGLHLSRSERSRPEVPDAPHMQDRQGASAR